MSQNREGEEVDLKGGVTNETDGINFQKRGDTRLLKDSCHGGANNASATNENGAWQRNLKRFPNFINGSGVADGNNQKIGNSTADKNQNTTAGSGNNNSHDTKSNNKGRQRKNAIDDLTGGKKHDKTNHASQRSADSINENLHRRDNYKNNVKDNKNTIKYDTKNINNSFHKKDQGSNNCNIKDNNGKNRNDDINNRNHDSKRNNNNNDGHRNDSINTRNSIKTNNNDGNNNRNHRNENNNYRNNKYGEDSLNNRINSGHNTKNSGNKPNNGGAHGPSRFAGNSGTGNQSATSPDQSRFLGRLRNSNRSINTKNSALPVDMNNKDDCLLWIQAWAAAAAAGSGSAGDHYILPAIMLRLPETESLMPNADDVINVLCSVVSSFLSEVNKRSLKDRLDVMTKGISSLETVLDVIRDRLTGKSKIINCSESVASSIEILTERFTAAVSLFFSTEFSDRAFTLVSRINEIKDYQTFVREVGALAPGVLTSATVDMSSDGWTSPSVGWLMSGTWHKVNKLKTEYKNAEEYTDTLKQIWTLLTFYWGAAAVWPKCKHRQQGDGGGGGAGGGEDKMCGEPLLALSKVGKEGRCSYKRGDQVCGNASSWKCHKGGHYEICGSCLVRQQEQLVGCPSLSASTDIYDAVVDRETTRREGTLFLLSGLRSRKPPAIAPNWMTTYRLQPAALVAVVRLGASGQKLSRDLQLQWAEVVAVDQKEEWKERRDGRITLRLLTRGDCSTLSTESDVPLESHTRVAIIDLRVFVPEVVSVLATLAGKDFCTHFSQIPFKDRLLGIPSAPSAVTYLPKSSVVSNIANALDHSEIEFVLRLDREGRSALASAIYAIPQVQTLYGTQLEAFTAALSSSAHCTQGPPGTGKSYIGVCLVLALDVIRTRAQMFGTPVGPGKDPGTLNRTK